MRSLPWIVCGITASLILSPLMFHLWLSLGTGNANFVFFQGLIMWLFAGLGIIEFIYAIIVDKSKGNNEKCE